MLELLNYLSVGQTITLVSLFPVLALLIYAVLKQEKILTISIVTVYLILAIITAINPDTIESFIYKQSADGGQEIQVQKKITPKEIVSAIQFSKYLGNFEFNNIYDKTLLLDAENKCHKERSEIDFLVLSIDALQNKRYSASLEFGYYGLMIASNAKIKSALESVLGRVYYHFKRFDLAEDLLYKAINTEPSNVIAYNSLGILLFDKGQLEEAEYMYKMVKKLAPSIGFIHYNLGKVYAKKGMPDKAINEYKLAITKNPNDAISRNNLANTIKDYYPQYENKAEDLYKEAMKINPRISYIYTNYGDLLQFNKGLLNDAKEMYQKAISLNPNEYKAYAGLGMLLLNNKKFVKAKKMYKIALKIAPNNNVIHYNMGLLYYLKGKDFFDDAEYHFRESIKIDPKYDLAYNGYGALLMQKNQIDKAVTMFRKAIAINPKNSSYYKNLASLLYKNGEVDEAIVMYKKTVNINEKDSEAYGDLAVLLYKNGEVEEAESMFKKAIAINQKDIQMHIYLACLLYEKGKNKEFEKIFKKAISIKPNSENIYLQIGMFLHQQGGLQRAEKLYNKVLDMNPKNGLAYLNLGILFMDIDKPEKAEELYRQAIKDNINNSGIYNNLGVLLYKKGEIVEGQMMLDKAKELKNLTKTF